MTIQHSEDNTQPSSNEGVSRRGFVQSAVVISTTAVAAQSVIAQEDAKTSERKRVNKGIIFKSTKGGGIGSNQKSMVARLNELKSLGFDGVEGASPGISDTKALRAAISETDFPVHGVVDMVHWRERLSSPDEKKREIGRLALEQAIKDTHAIGGSAVLLVPGRVSGDDENHDHVWTRSITEIRKVLPVASWYGIRILIENVWNGFCETPEQLRDYIDEINSPWVGVYFDIGNVRKFGPSEDWIRALGQRIVKCDVKDWGKKNGFCKLGEGDVNWPEVRKSLAEIGFTGWVTREGSDGGLQETARLMDELLDL